MNTTRSAPTTARRVTDLWPRFWSSVGNEEWLAARRLLDLSPRVRNFYGCYLQVRSIPRYGNEGTVPVGLGEEVTLDWDAAATRIGCDGFSSTEGRLARLVASLTTGEPLDLASLAWMGSWRHDVWMILVEWGTEGQLTTSSSPRNPS